MKNNKIKVVRWGGDAMDGHNKNLIRKYLIEILSDKDLPLGRSDSIGRQTNLSFHELIKLKYLPDFLLTKYTIDLDLFNSTVKPFLQENPYTIKYVIEQVLNDNYNG